MANRLLILGAGIMQIPIIVKAQELGYETIVVDFDEKAPGIKYSSKFYNVSTLDKDNVLRIAQTEKISGILTTSDAPVRVVAYVGKRLGLPSMSEKVSEICTNKYLQRLFLKNHDIKCPEFYLCNSESNLKMYNHYPYIVKPVDSSASRGVSKVNNYRELKDAVSDALSYSKQGEVIIESFIEGKEFSVETLTQNNHTSIIAITEKLTRGEKDGYFVEDTHLEPARISEYEKIIIEDEVLKVINALAINNCPTHTEIRINKNGAFIIEIACRLGGDYITSDLVPLSTGVDMMDNLIRLSVGEKIDTERKINATSAVQFINPDNYNKCENYISSNSKYIKKYNIDPYENKLVRNSFDRLGYIIIQCPDFFKIEEELQKIS